MIKESVMAISNKTGDKNKLEPTLIDYY